MNDELKREVPCMTEIPANILLVDDDVRSLIAMESLLAGPGRQIVKADSGQNALRKVLHQDFAVILLDVRMPRVDGFETAELIRQRDQSRYIPIIFLSAVDKMDEDVFRGLASGAVDYLFKPVVPEILQSKVSVFVELYRMRERAKQQAVRHSEERFRLLVDSMKDYSIIMLNPEGMITSWNPGASLIHGYEADEIMGRHFSSFLPPDDTGPGGPGAALQVAATIGRYEEEGWRLRKDGTKFWANVVITALKDESGRLSAFAKVTRDLSERKATEEQLRELATELEQRVAERTQELVHSRHRLRELATELTLTEQRERRRLAGELHDYLAQLLVLMRMKIRQAAPRIPDERATALLKDADHAITESLSYTRSLVAELAPPALQEFGLLEGFAWLVEQMQTHGLTVEIRKGLERVVIPDDQAVLVFQSVRELLFNVLKHAGTGRAELSVEINAGELAIMVTDKGRGFDLSEVTGNEKGKRFGLFSIRERMEAMGGRFMLASVPDQGTRATLILPYWPATERRSEAGVLGSELTDTVKSPGLDGMVLRWQSPERWRKLKIRHSGLPPRSGCCWPTTMRWSDKV